LGFRVESALRLIWESSDMRLTVSRAICSVS
jgi:hypothetical protein